MIPILHVVIMLAIIMALAILAGVSWLYAVGTFAVFLLAIVAIYRR